MAKDNINQELTRQNIIELRKKHGFTQVKVAELMGGSRSMYNGIENGKVKITEYYVQTLADVYGVSFESIAVFASGYDEGFYQGMKVKAAMQDSQFDTRSMKVYHTGKELLTGKKYTSTLYPSLKEMGYVIEVVDMEELDPVQIPPDVRENAHDGKIFIIMKGNRTIGYVAPSDYYAFERFLNIAVKGFLDEVHENYKKYEKNSGGDGVIYDKLSNRAFRKGSSKLLRFRKDSEKISKHSTLKRVRHSPQDKYSANKQMKQIKEELRTHGIKEDKDENND